MKFKLRTRLSLSYVLLALFLVALISILTNVFLERQFRDYIIKQQEARNGEIVSMISQQFKGSRWEQTTVENIGINALEQGLIVKVTNREGGIVWDATQHNNGLCIQMINHMSQNMTSRYPNFQGDYMVKQYPLQQGSAVIGNVTIGYYGPFYFTDHDLAFINTLNKMLLAVGLFSLLLALVVGAYTAQRLSTPILKAAETAQNIAHGEYAGRIDVSSNIIEIDALAAAINGLAESLGQQEQLRRRLTADVAHELRTPLATLQSHMEAMIDGIWAPDTARLKSCHEEIMRIGRMVGDLEKLARYESEELVLDKEHFDLKELAQQVIKLCETEFVHKNVILSFQGYNSPVLADRDKISQVVVNLLSNALKYTPASGRVEVTVGHDERQGIITVRDTGVGISPQDLPHIFERFYRADRSRNRQTGGSGVGLAIVKAIVEAHGGALRVESSMGQGTQFTVSLPGYEAEQ